MILITNHFQEHKRSVVLNCESFAVMGNCLCGLKTNRPHFEITVFDANLPGCGTYLLTINAPSPETEVHRKNEKKKKKTQVTMNQLHLIGGFCNLDPRKVPSLAICLGQNPPLSGKYIGEI